MLYNIIIMNFNKFLKISIIFLIIFVWIFSGWFQIWKNPPIPPEVQEVKAATATKTFTFATSAEGFTGTSGGKSNLTYDSGVGNPAGSLKTDSAGRNNLDTSDWTWTGTWEDLGIPAGSTVTQIRLDAGYTKVTAWNVVDSVTIGPYKLKDSGGVDQATLWTGRTPTGADSDWVAISAQTDQNVPSALQASNSTIKLYLERTIDLGNDKNAQATIYEDQLSFVITYTSPVPADPEIQSSTHTDGAKSNVANVTFTCTAGTPTPDHYHYLWDQVATHTKTEVSAGTQWDGTTLNKTCASDGDWYLHVISHDASHNESDNIDTFHIDYDGTAPQVNATATAQDSTTVRIVYNEPVKHVSAANSDDALNPNNYSIAPSLSVISVTHVSGDTIFDLTTESQTASESYTITVTNVQDEYGNTIDSAHDEATFTGYAAPEWIAYNDCGNDGDIPSFGSSGNVTNFGAEFAPTSGELIKYSDGTGTGVTLSYSGTGITEGYGLDQNRHSLSGPPYYPKSGTDAYTEFGEIINMGKITFTSDPNDMTVTLSGVSHSHTYTLVVLGMRGNYDNRRNTYTISDVDSFINESSSGTVISTVNMTNDSTTYNAGDNYNEGYVAKWTNIVPTDNQITVTVTSPDSNKRYISAIKLIDHGVAASTITITSSTVQPSSVLTPSTDNQPSSVLTPSTDNILGSASIVRNAGTGQVTAVTIKENGGTIDAQNDLENIELWLSSDDNWDEGDNQLDTAKNFGRC